MKADDIPTFQVEVKPNPSFPHAVLLTFTCERCGMRIQHGSREDDGPHYGHRQSHCECWPKGYCLTATTNEQPGATSRRVITTKGSKCDE